MNKPLMTRALALIAFVLVAAILVGCASPTIATVNGETISVKDFQDRYKFDVFLRTSGEGAAAVPSVETAGDLTLATMISERIVLQKAKDADLTVSDAEIQSTIESDMRGQDFDKLVTLTAEGTGLSEARIRELWNAQIRGRLLLDKLEDEMGQDAADLVKQWNSEATIDIQDGWQNYIPIE